MILEDKRSLTYQTKMENRILFEELRLIERNESEVSSAWKGAHLLLFFLAFVFGSFCTFCFHILMYLFDEKCVLYPKLLSLNALRHTAIYGFLPEETDKSETLPVDFLSTQFVHKSACYLPTYVPLVSGIFGLVWTTMFLMCSSGSRSLSGLQRPWRVIMPVLVFSLAMSGLCIYSSVITHYGLQDLCVKLGGITGSTSNTCSYSVNVVTLAFERQIRGVFQATRLTITTAWLHTGCWVASALLAIIRILLAVDFRLVKIRAEIIGNMDRVLEQNEKYLQTVMPSPWSDADELSGGSKVYYYFKNEKCDTVTEYGTLEDVGSDILFVSEQSAPTSEHALVAEERNKSLRIMAVESTRVEHRFIVKMLYDILDIVLLDSSSSSDLSGSSNSDEFIDELKRQYGQQEITSQTKSNNRPEPNASLDSGAAIAAYKTIKHQLLRRLDEQLVELPLQAENSEPPPSTSKKRSDPYKSRLNLTPEMENIMKGQRELQESRSLPSYSNKTSHSKTRLYKSNLKAKDAAIQTDKKKSKGPRVKIVDAEDGSKRDSESSSNSKTDEITQTKPKEKQD